MHRLGTIHQDAKELLRFRSKASNLPEWDPTISEELEMRLQNRRKQARAKHRRATEARLRANRNRSDPNDEKKQMRSRGSPTRNPPQLNSYMSAHMSANLGMLGTVNEEDQKAMNCAAVAVKRALIQANAKAYAKLDPKV